MSKEEQFRVYDKRFNSLVVNGLISMNQYEKIREFHFSSGMYQYFFQNDCQ